MSDKPMEVLVHLFLLAAINFAMTQSQSRPNVLIHPEDVTVCEGRETVFTCELDAVVDVNKVEWRRYTNNDGTRMIDLNDEDMIIDTKKTENGTTISQLIIHDVRIADMGSYWIDIQLSTFCNASLTVMQRPSVSLNITKSIEDSSAYLQWDTMNNSLQTYYTLAWLKTGRNLQIISLIDQTSYKMTGLDLDTAYTVTINAANTCGQGPEFTTSFIIRSNPTSSTPIISTTVTTTSTSVTTTSSSPSVTTSRTGVTGTSVTTTSSNPSVTTSNTGVTTTSSSLSVTTTSTFVTTTSSSPTGVSTASTSVTTTSSNPSVTTTSTIVKSDSVSASPDVSPDATNVIMTLPLSVVGPTVTAKSDSTPTTVISFMPSAASPTMSSPVSVSMMPSLTSSIATTSSIRSSTSTTTTTTTAITTTHSISTTTTTAATSTSSSTTPDATTSSNPIIDASDTSATMSPKPTGDLTDKSSDDGFNIADYRYIAAGVLGGLIVFFVIIVICCCCCCCCRKRKDNKDVDGLKLDHYNTLTSDGSPSKGVPSVTNAMTMSGEDDTASIKDETDSAEAGLNSLPLNPPDTYDRLEVAKLTNPTDVYDKLEPRQPFNPTDTYDKLPPSSTFHQMQISDTMYDKLPPSNTFHNFSSTSTYDKLPRSNTSDKLSNSTHYQVPSTPSNTYDRVPSSKTFDKLPSTSTYDRLPSSNTVHSFPVNNYDKLPSTTSHYNKLPPSRTFDKLPTIPAASERLPATSAFTKLLETKIEEVPDASTDDFSHYYDELPCNVKKDAHTGENAYQGEEDPSVHYAVLEPLPKSKSKVHFSDDPTKLYAQIA